MTTTAEPEALSVEFDVTRADMEVCLAQQVASNPDRLSVRQTFVVLLLVAIMVGFILWRSAPPGPTGWATVGVYALFPAWLLMKVLRLYQDPCQQVLDQLIATCGEDAVLGPERITISSEGIRSDHGFCTLMHRWGGVEAIEVNGDDVRVTTGEKSSYRIPRRAFSSDASMQHFVERAKAWHNNAVSEPQT